MKLPEICNASVRLVCSVGLLVLGLAWSICADSPQVSAVRIAGAINPVVAEFVNTQLQEANRQQAAAFLIEIDTPGGLDTAMREIIQGILASEVPVIVYVYPSGARAASAGALITLAADFAVMAPGTNIGAATPVSIGGTDAGNENQTMKDKVVNDAVAYARSLAAQRGRNVEWAEHIITRSLSTAAGEALELKVIDLVAASEAELFEKLDGQRYLRHGEPRTLAVAGAELVFAEMNWRQQILDTISNPTVAYLLMMLGMLGIFFEISQPGAILPGAIGSIAILLALFAFQSLPVNYVGVLLILLSLVLFILEVKVTSFGMLTVGGIVSLALGSLMLIDSPEPYLQISRGVILVTVLAFASFIVLCLVFIVRTQRSRFTSGSEAMIGEQGKAVTAIDGHGTVFVHGEYWNAVARQAIKAGTPVEVVAMAAQMSLEVRAVDRSTDRELTGEGDKPPIEEV